MKASKGEKVFYIINNIVLAFIVLICLYPIIYVFSASISSPAMLYEGKVVLFPKELTFASYKKVLSDSEIFVAFLNSVYYMVVGTAYSLAVTIGAAYPLSKKWFYGRKFFTIIMAITMWFGGGMIPQYLNIRDLGLIDTRTAIIVAFAVAPFNIIIMRTFFQSVPESLEEAAVIDGATNFQILSKIYLPLSKAAIATIGLFCVVARWNGYFWAMVLITDNAKIPLQVLLKKLIVDASLVNETDSVINVAGLTSKETIIYTTIVVSMLPMLIVYPFLQKYFVKGVMIGSIKG